MTTLAIACALLALATVIGIAVYACRAATAWNREVDELTRRADMWERVARGNGHDEPRDDDGR
jgi:hypothetical protein